MEPLKQLNLAMQYIEDNLANEIDIKQAAQIACCSEYHFKRMFSFLSGATLSEYIRYRKLTLAAIDLQKGNMKVIDVAVKYGYESPDSFARAFQGFHGVTPSDAKKLSTSLKAVPPMSFQITIQGGNAMQYRIIEKEAFKIVGIMKRVTLIYNGVNPEIAAMWQSLTMDDIQELKQLSNVEPMGLLSVSTNFSEGRREGGALDQYIGVATDKEDHDRWESLQIPAFTWAVFTASGPFPQTLQNIWGRIYSEWFPTSGYESIEGPEILWNEGKDVDSPNFKSEIWIPVIKR